MKRNSVELIVDAYMKAYKKPLLTDDLKFNTGEDDDGFSSGLFAKDGDPVLVREINHDGKIFELSYGD